MATGYLVVPWRIAVNNFIHVWIALKYGRFQSPMPTRRRQLGNLCLRALNKRSREDDVANVVITKNKDPK